MARRTSARRSKQQSTLTQLDFVSTPHDETIDSDNDGWIADLARPRKRLRTIITPARPRARRKRESTLTQIGFLKQESEGEEKHEPEIIADSQSYPSHAVSVPASPPDIGQQLQDENSVIPLSPRTGSSAKLKIPSTPKQSRITEARSSQTPPSIALSSVHGSRLGRTKHITNIESRSVRFQLSPAAKQPAQLIRKTTIEDSQYEEPAISLPGDDDPWSDAEPEQPLTETQALVEQCTFDPALSALDRDVDRCRWTQLRGSLPIVEPEENAMSDPKGVDLLRDDTQPKELIEQFIREDIPSSTASSPSRRASQVSTVLPTQSSPRPGSSVEEITPVLTKIASEPTQGITCPSSDLPGPPWSDAERADWLRTSQAQDTRAGASLIDFSLPHPPPVHWSTISSSMASRES